MDGEKQKLVVAADEALVEFHHAARLERCDWAISAEDGALANTAHRGAVTELVAVAGLRARLRFAQGNPQGATADLLDAIAAARHLSVDGSLTSVLISYRLENSLTAVVARNLHRLTPKQLSELANDLQALPRGSDLGAALVSEKLQRNDFLDLVAKRARNREDLITLLLRNAPVLQSDHGLAAQIVDGCGGSVDGFAKCAKQQHSFYESWADRFNRAPEQFERAYNAEIEGASKNNPLIRQFTPRLPRFRWIEAYSRTRRALLQAAILVQIDGPVALGRDPDPYNGLPFSYSVIENGFRLESQLRDNGALIALSVAPTSDGP